jgi:O-antigen ligase
MFGYAIGAGPDLSQYLGFSAHAHNGYLQLLLELGYVGAFLFGGSLIFAIVRVIRSRDTVLAGVLTVFVVANFANNFLISPHLAVILYAWCAVASMKPASVPPATSDGAVSLAGKKHIALQ